MASDDGHFPKTPPRESLDKPPRTPSGPNKKSPTTKVSGRPSDPKKTEEKSKRATSKVDVTATLKNVWKPFQPFLGVIQRAEAQKPGFRQAVRQVLIKMMPLVGRLERDLPPLPKPSRRRSKSPLRLPPTSSSSSSSSDSSIASGSSRSSSLTSVRSKGNRVIGEKANDKPKGTNKSSNRLVATPPKPTPKDKVQGATQDPDSKAGRSSKEAEKTPVENEQSGRQNTDGKGKETQNSDQRKSATSKTAGATRSPSVTSSSDLVKTGTVNKAKVKSSDKKKEIRPKSALEKLHSSLVKNPAASRTVKSGRPKSNPVAPPPSLVSSSTSLESIISLEHQHPRVRLTRMSSFAPSWLQQAEAAGEVAEIPRARSDSDGLELDAHVSSMSEPESLTPPPQAVSITPPDNSTTRNPTGVAAVAPLSMPSITTSRANPTSLPTGSKVTRSEEMDFGDVPGPSTSSNLRPSRNHGGSSTSAPFGADDEQWPGKVPFCYNCRRRGHKRSECPYPKREDTCCLRCGTLNVTTDNCLCHDRASRRRADGPALPAQAAIRPAFNNSRAAPRGVPERNPQTEIPSAAVRPSRAEPLMDSEPSHSRAYFSSQPSGPSRHSYPPYPAHSQARETPPRSSSRPETPTNFARGPQDLRHHLGNDRTYTVSAEEYRWLQNQRRPRSPKYKPRSPPRR